jgi:hypothetical protein
MTSLPAAADPSGRDHQTWVHSRLLLDKGCLDAVRQGFTMIAAGFGSFAIFDGLASVRDRDALPKAFALILTTIGIIVILLAVQHNRKMTAWVNSDEFGAGPVPALPDERRTEYLAAAVGFIGIISFIALLRLP